MAEKKMWLQQETSCKPLNTYSEVLSFLQDPPPWRTLCIKLQPHSKKAIRNIEINPAFGETLLEVPQTFCHYLDPEAEEVQRQDRKKLPKTLVCHDMANGYHDDCIIDGTSNWDAYTFYNWGGIDIFCYFSHHLITIPPLGWINVGHAHGVKVIGTVITEWNNGVEFWDKILASQEESHRFASALVTIAKTLKFDGWLLNVENRIAKPDALLEFVRFLHSTMHKELDDPVLIWYDSVTVEGDLSWQNELNEKNKAFFDAVDGFFTNYSWNEKNVEFSAKMAGDRLTDLFIGIDVWGRNFYGGGQFNTQEAIQIAHDHGCSLAIFAQAWTHEAMCDPKTDANCVPESYELNKFERFLLRDRALWGSIWPYLNTSLPTALPFKTSFCKGQGKKRRLYGEVICPRPWFNLRHMQYQLNSSHGPHGYILSTQDNIKSLSVQGLLKDKAAVTRYRRSLEATRLQVFSGKSDLLDSHSMPSLINEDHEGVDTNEVDGNKQTQNHKSKVKNYFRHLFRTKASKIEEEKEITPVVQNKIEISEQKVNELPAGSSEPTEAVATTTGRSMVQVSANLPLGQPVKTQYVLVYIPTELQCLEPFYEDSFTGGSCLKINPCDVVCTEHRLIRLFHCDFYCEKSLIACVVTKTMVGLEDQFLNVKLFGTDAGGKDVRVVLVGHDIPHASQTSHGSLNVLNVYPCLTSDPEFKDLQRYMLLNEPEFYTPIENSFGWKIRYYEIKLPGARFTSINCRTGLSERGEGPILLGCFGLCSRVDD